MLDFVAMVGINMQRRNFFYGTIRLAIAYTSEGTHSSTATTMPQQNPLNYMYLNVKVPPVTLENVMS